MEPVEDKAEASGPSRKGLKWWFAPTILLSIMVICSSMALYHARIWEPGPRPNLRPPEKPASAAGELYQNPGRQLTQEAVPDDDPGDYRSRLLVLMNGNWPIDYHGGDDQLADVAASRAAQTRARRWCEGRLIASGLPEDEAREIVSAGLSGNREAGAQVLDAIESSHNETRRMQCAVLLYGAAYPEE